MGNRPPAGTMVVTSWCKVRCGIPQGDPLSGYNFILVIEILIIKLNSFPELKTTATLAGGTPPLT